MIDPQLPRRHHAPADRSLHHRRAARAQALLRRVARRQPRAVLGVLAYWLGSSEGNERVGT